MSMSSAAQQPPFPRPQIKGYHSHVYFDAPRYEQALALCQAADAQFDELVMGRMHQRPVGPHPDWSCQLAYPAHLLNEVLDRKSTRLNSSHVAISYAVFCLTKKTTQ